MSSSLLVTQELGLIRKPASFMTSICDERGQELIYAGMPITEVFKAEIGLGGTLGLLWFQRRWASGPEVVGWTPEELPEHHRLCCCFSVQVAEVRLPVHRDVPHGYGRPRAGRFWSPQHHCLRPRRQRSDLQPHLWPSHHCKICAQ